MLLSRQPRRRAEEAAVREATSSLADLLFSCLGVRCAFPLLLNSSTCEDMQRKQTPAKTGEDTVMKVSAAALR